MSRVVPRTINEKIDFFTVHAPTWVENHEVLGVTEEFAEEVAELTQAAIDARLAQAEAELAARSATQMLHIALQKLEQRGAALIAIIKATAKASESVSVLSAGSISPEKTPTHSDQIYGTIHLNLEARSDGCISISWKGIKQSRATYLVERRTSHGFELAGVATNRKFIDHRPQVVDGMAWYRIRVVRGSNTWVSQTTGICAIGAARSAPVFAAAA